MGLGASLFPWGRNTPFRALGSPGSQTSEWWRDPPSGSSLQALVTLFCSGELLQRQRCRPLGLGRGGWHWAMGEAGRIWATSAAVSTPVISVFPKGAAEGRTELPGRPRDDPWAAPALSGSQETSKVFLGPGRPPRCAWGQPRVCPQDAPLASWAAIRTPWNRPWVRTAALTCQGGSDEVKSTHCPVGRAQSSCRVTHFGTLPGAKSLCSQS